MTNLCCQNRNLYRRSIASTKTLRRNTIKDMTDTESLIKDIKERDDIIQNYRITRSLDRDNAIKKIMELRSRDIDIYRITMAGLAISSTPFNIATNEQIIRDLETQKNILEAKLIKIDIKENK